jgi:hypothetical protein
LVGTVTIPPLGVNCAWNAFMATIPLHVIATPGWVVQVLNPSVV